MSVLFQALQRLDGERAVLAALSPAEADEFLKCAAHKSAPKPEAGFQGPNDDNGAPRAEAEPRPAQWPQAAGTMKTAEDRGDSTPAVTSTGPMPALRAGVKRVAAVLRAALPLVERMLPLLEGPTTDAAGSSLATAPAPPVLPQPQTADVARIVEGIAEIKAEHRELLGRVVEQNASLKRTEGGLGMIREATDRNTREQQELIEDLRDSGHKVHLLAAIAFGLIAVSVLLNIALYLRILNLRP